MIADAHYHLDPRLESIERLLAQMREHAIGRVALIAARAIRCTWARRERR
jgi:hypothetical protein